MPIDVTAGPHPAFAASPTVADAVCTEIRASPFSKVMVFGSGAMLLFNGVAEGDAAPAATLRKSLTADQAAAGLLMSVGGAVAGHPYGTICVAGSGGTITVEVITVPPTREAP
tara:strand:- start:116 stop:454 length:339 start_codon:yes stop_codon:yes gene_type:complete